MKGNSKGLIVWLIIAFILLIASYQVLRPQKTDVYDLAFSDFLKLIKEGKVAKVYISKDWIEGEFKEPLYFPVHGRGFIEQRPFAKFRTPRDPFSNYPLEERLEEYGITFYIEPPSSFPQWVTMLASGLLPVILFIAVMIFISRQMQGASNKALSFGKSRAKRFDEKYPKVTFADVAGCEEAKEELKEIVDFLKDPKKYQRLGGRIPKGVLLVGPPGTGKTLLARAVAGEAGVPFFSISGSDFVEMFVGVGASVTGDTPVLIRDSQGTRLTTIGEFVDRFYEGKEDGDEPIPVSGVWALSMEMSLNRRRGWNVSLYPPALIPGRAAWKKVGGVYRHKVKEIYEIKHTGGVLRATADHSVFIQTPEGAVAKPTKELKPGDPLVSPYMDWSLGREINPYFRLQARELGRKSARKRETPDLIWDIPRELFLNYLEGCIEGGVKLGLWKAEASSASEEERSWRISLLDEGAAGFLREMIWLCSVRGMEVEIDSQGGELKGAFISTGQKRELVIEEITKKPFDGYVYDLCSCENEAFLGGEIPVLLHNSRVRDLFETARKNAPCIVFIDELDAVGRYRGAGIGGGHDEREQTLNQLLVEMSGFDSSEGVIVLAATNRPDILDPALLRPGRFDRQIVVDLPDVNGRKEIFKIHLRKVKAAPEVWENLDVLAKGTPYFSGADIENMVNEAALIAARKNKEWVDMECLEEAKDKVMMGPERKSLLISENERRMTAYHEAGHALVAHLLPEGDPNYKCSIIPRGRALGVTQKLPMEERHTYTKKYLLAEITTRLAGRAAEELVFGEQTTGAKDDFQRATELAKSMVCEWGMSDRLGPVTFGKREEQIFLGKELTRLKDYSEKTAQEIDEEVKRIIQECYERAKRIIQENMDKLKRLAEALLEKEVLDAKDIEAILGPRPQPQEPRPASINSEGENEGDGQGSVDR